MWQALKKEKMVFVGILLFIGLLLGIYFVGQYKSSTNSSSQVNLSQPYITKQINQSFSFPIKDSSGNQIAAFTYTMQSLNLQNEIIIKGQKAEAIQGRTFLILTIKVTNPTQHTLSLNSRDFVRISLDNSKDRLAPSIHNDPIIIQPISTEYSRLALPINTTTKQVTLFIGEITGVKKSISISLHQ